MKVNTIEQFKVLEFLKSNFEMDCIELELLDRYSIKVTDKTGDILTFRYENGKIIY